MVNSILVFRKNLKLEFSGGGRCNRWFGKGIIISISPERRTRGCFFRFWFSGLGSSMGKQIPYSQDKVSFRLFGRPGVGACDISISSHPWSVFAFGNLHANLLSMAPMRETILQVMDKQKFQ
ncbi:hypothetical protein CEXT_731751 [Caerostris extrusa]|uniref:Uncharacterized protein n=1 Tax=Caerostris extrusa TaxID=172846 RepID=A0AAV4NBI8_CAEEX|nr:hypothetical protein CEXT_731751 [Caerostris extrusa]